MSNKFAIKKRGFAFLAVFCCAALLLGVAGFATVAHAEEKVERNIYSYLTEKSVTYSSVSVNNKVLTAELISTGTDRCTLEDVKAIQAIYEAVHGKNVIGNVEDVQIIIYNSAGDIIYDYFQADVASPVEAIDSLVSTRSNTAHNIDTKTISDEITSVAETYPFTIENVIMSNAEEIAGQKVELVLNERDPGSISINDLNSLYAELEAYSFATSSITQCVLTVENDSGDCLFYMAGDFEYGNCIAWVNPSMDNSVIAAEGPKQ